MLYHGTSIKFAKSILQHGLCPRGAKGKTNWEHTLESRPDCVYLTAGYAGYFAGNAGPVGPWAIFEIDTEHPALDPAAFLPDEDFLEQATRGSLAAPDGDMKQRTRWFREHAERYQHLWQESVAGLGTCAYRGIVPPEAITRAVRFNGRAAPELALAMMDPTITIQNWMVMGSWYRALTAWLFDPTEMDLDALVSKGLVFHEQFVEILRASRELHKGCVTRLK